MWKHRKHLQSSNKSLISPVVCSRLSFPISLKLSLSLKKFSILPLFAHLQEVIRLASSVLWSVLSLTFHFRSRFPAPHCCLHNPRVHLLRPCFLLFSITKFACPTGTIRSFFITSTLVLEAGIAFCLWILTLSFPWWFWWFTLFSTLMDVFYTGAARPFSIASCLKLKARVAFCLWIYTCSPWRSCFSLSSASKSPFHSARLCLLSPIQAHSVLACAPLQAQICQLRTYVLSELTKAEELFRDPESLQFGAKIKNLRQITSSVLCTSFSPSWNLVPITYSISEFEEYYLFTC